MRRLFVLFALAMALSCSSPRDDFYDVIVAGGGASGVCAGIQAAPCGAAFFG